MTDFAITYVTTLLESVPDELFDLESFTEAVQNYAGISMSQLRESKNNMGKLYEMMQLIEANDTNVKNVIMVRINHVLKSRGPQEYDNEIPTSAANPFVNQICSFIGADGQMPEIFVNDIKRKQLYKSIQNYFIKQANGAKEIDFSDRSIFGKSKRDKVWPLGKPTDFGGAPTIMGVANEAFGNLDRAIVDIKNKINLANKTTATLSAGRDQYRQLDAMNTLNAQGWKS